MARQKLKVYGEDEIKARLAAELPHWYLEEGWIRRRYRTSSWKGTLRRPVHRPAPFGYERIIVTR